MTPPERFHIQVPKATLDRITQRLQDYEWPRLPAGEPWKLGMDEAGLRSLVEHWLHRFDAAAQIGRANVRTPFTPGSGVP